MAVSTLGPSLAMYSLQLWLIEVYLGESDGKLMRETELRCWLLMPDMSPAKAT